MNQLFFFFRWKRKFFGKKHWLFGILQIRQFEMFVQSTKRLKVNVVLTTYEILLKDKVSAYLCVNST